MGALREVLQVWNQEALLLEFTESVSRLMEENNVTKHMIAGRTGFSLSYVNEVLEGEIYPGIREMADFYTALGVVAKIQTERDER